MDSGNLARDLSPANDDSHMAWGLELGTEAAGKDLVGKQPVRLAPAVKSRVKRIVDAAVAGSLLVFLSPLLLALSLVVLITMGRPIFFVQYRPGLNGKSFPFYKFRSMRLSRNKDGSLKSDSERLTWIGRLLRATSLDELPQLWSVLKGDMSLVGPRPLLVEYLPLYSPEQSRRHNVRPGITGWAQVNGRNSISWKEKFQHDIYYVDNWSLWLDLKILLLTLKKVVWREGINNSSVVPMPRFMGGE